VRPEHDCTVSASGQKRTSEISTKMNSNLKRAIESICLNRDSGTWDSLDEEALLGLIEEFGQDDLADKLYREIPKVIPFEVVCDLFNILAWRTDDNGSSVTRAIERWLRTSKDQRKLLISLHLEVYPFIDPIEMEKVLLILGTNNARISRRCAELISQRKKMNKN
jgi:hypothetical protein